MRLGRFRLLASILSGITAIAGVCIGFVVSSGPGQAAQGQPNIRTAAAGSASTVGALFLRSPSGQLTTHFCTGSVVDTRNALGRVAGARGFRRGAQMPDVVRLGASRAHQAASVAA